MRDMMPPKQGRHGLERSARLALACLASAAAIAAAWYVPRVVPCTQDDGFIYFRIADNAARGLGPVFNPGERVNAATSPAWLLLLAAGARLGVSPHVVAAVAAIAALLAAAVVAAAWSVELAAPRSHTAIAAAVAPALLLVFDARLWLLSLSGMETSLAACTWILAARALIRRCIQDLPARGAGWLALLAVLVRPEFAVFVFAIIVWSLARRTITGVRLARVVWPLLAGGIAYAIAHTAYFGDPFPNTFHAKRAADWAHARLGLAWLGAAPRAYPWLLVAFLACFLPWRRMVLAPIGLGIAAYAVFLVMLGGDHFVFHRPMLHFMPMAIAAIGTVSARLADLDRRDLRALVAFLLAGLLVHSASRRLPPGAFAWVRQAAQLGHALARTYPPQTRLGLFAIGATGYTSRMPVVDALGLADARLARTRHPDVELVAADIGHEHGDPEDLLRRSDVIVLFGAYAPVPFESLDEVRIGFHSHERFLRQARAAMRQGTLRLRNIEFAPGAYWAVLERES
jgi:hypothetical protein